MRQTDKSFRSEKFKQVVTNLVKPQGKSPAPDRIQYHRDLDRLFPCWPGSGYIGTAPKSVLFPDDGPRPFQVWDLRPQQGGKEAERLQWWSLADWEPRGRCWVTCCR